MFKKGKKTQVVKFDDDEGNEQTNEISQNLMNDISQMKIKESKVYTNQKCFIFQKAENIKKIKNESNISFDEDISVR